MITTRRDEKPCTQSTIEIIHHSSFCQTPLQLANPTQEGVLRVSGGNLWDV